MALTKLFFLFSFFSLLLFGRYDAVAVKACEAFNNMKHTKNTDNLRLHPSTHYTVLRKHKGQFLLLLKGENPAQRWVDETCLESSEKIAEEVTHTSSKGLLLALSWHNAFCETHPKRKSCQRTLFSFGKKPNKEEYLVLHGLWPQPRSAIYCNVNRKFIALDKHREWNRLPEPKLTTSLKERLAIVMPGVVSYLHRHEWIKHGTCYGKDAEAYFEKAVALTEQVNDSSVGRFFRRHIGKRVTLSQIRYQFDRSFGKGAGKRVELRCRKGLISELWLHLGTKGEELASLLKEGKTVYSKCYEGVIDRAGYGR